MTYLYHGWARFSPRCRWYLITEADDAEWCREKLAACMQYQLPKKRSMLISTVVLPASERPDVVNRVK